MIKDFSKYTQEQWIEFIKFIDFHIEIKEKRKGEFKDMFNITTHVLTAFKEIMTKESDPWLPFISELEPFRDKYIHRIRNFSTLGLKYIETRPNLINDEMKTLMNKSPTMMGKYLRISNEPLPPPLAIIQTPQPITIQSKQMEIIVDSVEYLQVLIKEAKKRKVSELSLKDILSALPKIVDAINKMQNRQVKIGSLTQINLNGSAQDLEDGMLAMIKSNEE